MTTTFRGTTLRPLPDLAAKGHKDAPMEEVGDPCSLPKAWLSSADKRLKAEVSPEIRGIVTFDMVKAGLHCSLRMSRQMLPLLLTFG
ncbi:hypothetical protein B296_00005518 [Ensete ventricosum]|uniref:Uncharacterized protein n=1 Tax=Ensete ventricosum TaxID=4639 RepID=A0A427ADI9_ENSVE|nr:hypothetical protein B296_00005518 [Ensete ventricosum]